MELQSETDEMAEQQKQMLDGLYRAAAAAALAHSAGARSVTRYCWKLGPAPSAKAGLGRSFLFFRKHRPVTQEAFPSDKPSQAEKQLASSTSLFDHDRWRSCLELQLQHHRHLNNSFSSWLHRRRLTQHPGLGLRTCLVLGRMTTSNTSPNHNHLTTTSSPTGRHSIPQTNRTSLIHLNHRNHPLQAPRVANSANVITTHAHVASVWRLSCPPAIHPQIRYQLSCALRRVSRTRTWMVAVYSALVCAKAARNMFTSAAWKPGDFRTLPQNVTTGSAQHVGTSIVSSV
jgi:hypothetical protein